MPVYTVHAPLAAGVDLRSTDRFVFIRDGFHLWAAVLGAVWLAWHRLWLALLGWVVLMMVVDVVLARIGIGAGTIAVVDLLLSILLGLEASSLKRWSYSRGNWRELDVVVADDLDAAERRFFERWAARRSTIGYDHNTVDRGAAPPTRDNGNGNGQRPPPLPHASIIGLFPEPGGGR
ncbi:hypothetical protein SSBR45G_24930 [Bradyrhizobium sp. SSBR45G]|uniref:DUF2628 domain-containing protein n=1 Tax=unclassified Bradyrhizobium TaxID=2631580 RepID=UPI002342BC9B|nr:MULTISPECIES: DUF2628 domain-containing protein [unclassified Bradyrhizobium]GLH77585.1 hypothetical protein SSBR45G_24930 [Bradyrhizobium sp. SSBR45G]GLH84822.1 hypothetical protein SSBR45R_22820 [Bradyrhizobium sp. SSBR45R]